MSGTSSDSRPQGREPVPHGERAKAVGHIVFNLALLGIAVMMFVHAGGLPSSAWEPIGSGSFPRLMLALLALLSVLMIIKEAAKLRHTSALPSGSVGDWVWRHRLAFGVLGLFTLYAIAMPLVGFRWATLPFVLACQVLLGARRPRQLAIAAAIALFMSVGLDALFRHVFTISLPRGALL
ncbi:Tripartite tricarboxylate transporter TctB family protein [Franzmannia pantelleriensis]|uniref:Tripartite tricarboxylate transporter TctB family protein n=1 Tax=Franzmannia pantelleriensis TaxID=48727 RepID=A0A1G9Q973_9GAMM|nr:tripartite tricarboxylate transporter TctB family protein [Halomonas pantelleriensis]SDM07608.1 Tripartite tricarboxylate transporter TctB family protein [Halomonas pantelleriensis]